MTTKSGVLVYSENEPLLLELLGMAHAANIGTVALASIGVNAKESVSKYANWGADRILQVSNPLLKDYNLETYTDALAGIIEYVQPAFVLIGATKIGIELSGKVAQRLEVGVASWCVDFEIDPQANTTTTKCMIYSGIGINTYKFNKLPVIATVNPGVFKPAEIENRYAETISIEVNIKEPAVQILGYEDKAGRGERLRDAEVIVDVGLGFKEKEDLHLAEELAQLLGGKITCSRPASSEKGWFPTWVGLSGDKVAPSLCFTVGTSGAIQHVIGIRESKTLVCVNNDENAAIFSQSDYGVLADLYEFLPSLIKSIKSGSYRIISK